MRKLLFVIVLMFIVLPITAQASFDNNIRYGTKNSDFVREIQEFLTDQGLYSGPISGNFYTLTLKAVKTFQNRERITPANGYWGLATRSRANELVKPDENAADEESLQSGENAPISGNDVAIRFPDGSTYNSNGKQLSKPTTDPATNPIGFVQPDFCNNIAGPQSEVPKGYYRSVDNDCFPDIQNPVSTPNLVTPTPKTPVITRLDPIQPSSYFMAGNGGTGSDNGIQYIALNNLKDGVTATLEMNGKMYPMGTRTYSWIEYRTYGQVEHIDTMKVFWLNDLPSKDANHPMSYQGVIHFSYTTADGQTLTGQVNTGISY